MTRAIVRVRAAEVSDAAAMAELVRTSEQRVHARSQSDSDPLRLAHRLRDLIAAPRRVFLVATDDEGAVAGMLAACHDEAGAVDLTPVLHINQLLVAPGQRRRGAGRALLAAAVQIAEQHGCEHVLATVGAGSREGNRYLARIGFAPMVLQRIAPVSVLHRTLGMTDVGSRMAVLRRARMVRAQRAGFTPRTVGRGA